MLMNNNQKPSNSSGLGSLAQSFLGGSSSNNNKPSSSSSGLTGQLIGSFLGGNKPPNTQGQQYNSQQGYGSNQQQSNNGQQSQQPSSSYGQSNQGQSTSSTSGSFLGKLFGGSGSVSEIQSGQKENELTDQSATELRIYKRQRTFPGWQLQRNSSSSSIPACKLTAVLVQSVECAI